MERLAPTASTTSGGKVVSWNASRNAAVLRRKAS
jgi:hypothetical protein